MKVYYNPKLNSLGIAREDWNYIALQKPIYYFKFKKQLKNLYIEDIIEQDNNWILIGDF